MLNQKLNKIKYLQGRVRQYLQSKNKDNNKLFNRPQNKAKNNYLFLNSEEVNELENKNQNTENKIIPQNDTPEGKNEVDSTKDASNNNNETNRGEDKNGNNEKDKDFLKEPEVYVIKWVDYSSKYGLGYLLNNDIVGVYFNDHTKITLNTISNNASYIERKDDNQKDIIYSFNLKEAPKELQKKIFIFQHFKKYFDEEIKYDREKEEKEKREKEEKQKEDTKMKMCKTSKAKKVKEKKIEKSKSVTKESDLFLKEGKHIFVRKWMKTNQAIFFRLSNKTIQVEFKDHTEIILYNDTINYKNKKGENKIFKIEDALNSSNFEMNKRIKYTQNILTKMINTNLKAY